MCAILAPVGSLLATANARAALMKAERRSCRTALDDSDARAAPKEQRRGVYQGTKVQHLEVSGWLPPSPPSPIWEEQVAAADAVAGGLVGSAFPWPEAAPH